MTSDPTPDTPPAKRRGRKPLPPELRKPRKSGRGGKARTMTPDEQAERDRLLSLALAKCHTERGSPASGTTWAQVAEAAGVPVSHLRRRGAFAPSVDARLREYVG